MNEDQLEGEGDHSAGSTLTDQGLSTAAEKGRQSRVLVTATIGSPGHRKQWKQVQVYPGSQEEEKMGREPKLERLQCKSKATMRGQGQDWRKVDLRNCSVQE